MILLRNNNILKFSLLLFAFVGFNMAAQDGSTSYSFLNQTSSSRIFGLGGINISTVEDNVNTVDMNPALLGPEMSGQVGLNYMRYVGDSNFAGVRYAHSAGEHGAWTAAVQYYGYGAMTWTDETGAILGDFSAKDMTFNFGFSHDITERLRGGIAVKMAYSAYEEYSAMALATDLGINYYDPENDFSVSVVAANLGGQVKKFQDRYEKLPMDVRLGMTKSFGTLPIRFSVTAWNLTKWHLPYLDGGDGSASSVPEVKDKFSSNLFRHLVFAADFVPSDRFYIGLGYNYKTRTDMNVYTRSMISGFSLSAGLNVGKVGLGMAFAQPHTGATTFMVNMNLNLEDIIN